MWPLCTLTATDKATLLSQVKSDCTTLHSDQHRRSVRIADLSGLQKKLPQQNYLK